MMLEFLYYEIPEQSAPQFFRWANLGKKIYKIQSNFYLELM